MPGSSNPHNGDEMFVENQRPTARQVLFALENRNALWRSHPAQSANMKRNTHDRARHPPGSHTLTGLDLAVRAQALSFEYFGNKHGGGDPGTL